MKQSPRLIRELILRMRSHERCLWRSIVVSTFTRVNASDVMRQAPPARRSAFGIMLDTRACLIDVAGIDFELSCSSGPSITVPESSS